jgi:hypothetical protein
MGLAGIAVCLWQCICVIFQLSGNSFIQRSANSQPPVIPLAITSKEGRFGLFARRARGAEPVACEVTQRCVDELVVAVNTGQITVIICSPARHPARQGAGDRGTGNIARSGEVNGHAVETFDQSNLIGGSLAARALRPGSDTGLRED